LARDARQPNNAIAAAVGIAPSTCLSRIRALEARGVVRGYFADLDPASLGRHLQAMIAVRLQPQARRQIRQFGHHMKQLPEVLNVFFLAGADDFLIHVAAASPEEVRDFVVTHLSADPAVAGTETNLIFEHLRSGAAPAVTRCR
jgi:DNA-binding Lrp family transcriptional regulator